MSDDGLVYMMSRSGARYTLLCDVHVFLKFLKEIALKKNLILFLLDLFINLVPYNTRSNRQLLRRSHYV